MFLDKERTKFFDFMIPIIPVINFSNSGEKLRGICKNLDLKVKDELIDDLCIFIEDMRLLYNIVNELSIYSKKLGKNLDINKLFAMIIYKNVYPNDFTKLNENSGILFTFIGKKREIIKNELKKMGFVGLLKDSFWAILCPVIILGSIYGGIADTFYFAPLKVEKKFKIAGIPYTISNTNNDSIKDVLANSVNLKLGLSIRL